VSLTQYFRLYGTVCPIAAVSAFLSQRVLAAGIVTSLATLLPAAGHGSYHDVVAVINAQLKSQPDNAALHFKLAQAHIGHEEWRACLDSLDRVERLAPNIHPTGSLRGLALLTGGRAQVAKETLDAFLAKNPTHSQALATRARALVSLDQPAQAVADFEKSVEHSASPDSKLILDFAKVYQKLGRYADASRIIDHALSGSEDSPALLRLALEIESAAGAWNSALSRIDALRQTAPRPEPWMAERARLLARAGRSDQARAAWTALHAHLLSLPNLDRGTPLMAGVLAETEKALGIAAPAPVIAQPATSQ
jgi:tetratricopeptide (TPR) repeat protein